MNGSDKVSEIYQYLRGTKPLQEEGIDEQTMSTFAPEEDPLGSLYSKLLELTSKKEEEETSEAEKTQPPSTKLSTSLISKPLEVETSGESDQLGELFSQLLQLTKTETETATVSAEEETPTLLRPVVATAKAVRTIIPTSKEEAEEVATGFQLGAREVVFRAWPEWIYGIKGGIEKGFELLKRIPVIRELEQASEKLQEKLPLLGKLNEALKEAREADIEKTEEIIKQIESLAPSEEELKSLEDPTVRAWAAIGSFVADLPRIIGLSTTMGPVAGPLFSRTLSFARPILSRLATNPRLFRLAGKFLVDLPVRATLDTAVFSLLHAPQAKEMIEGAKTGLTFGLLAGPAPAKIQPLATAIAAWISAKREGMSDEDAAVQSILFASINKFLPHSERVIERLLKVGGASKEEIETIKHELDRVKYLGEPLRPEVKKRVSELFDQAFARYGVNKDTLLKKVLTDEDRVNLVRTLEEMQKDITPKHEDSISEIKGILDSKSVPYLTSSLKRLDQALKRIPQEKRYDAWLRWTIKAQIRSIENTAEKWLGEIAKKARPTAFEKKVETHIDRAKAELAVDRIRALVPFQQARDIPLYERAERLSEHVVNTLKEPDNTVVKTLERIAKRSRRELSDEERIKLESLYEEAEKKVFELETQKLTELFRKHRSVPPEEKQRLFKEIENFARTLHQSLTRVLTGKDPKEIAAEEARRISDLITRETAGKEEPVPEETRTKLIETILLPREEVIEPPPPPRRSIVPTKETVVRRPIEAPPAIPEERVVIEAGPRIERAITPIEEAKPEISPEIRKAVERLKTFDAEKLLKLSKVAEDKYYIFDERDNTYKIAQGRIEKVKIPTEELPIEDLDTDAFDIFILRHPKQPDMGIAVLGKTGRIIATGKIDRLKQRVAKKIIENFDEIRTQIEEDIRSGRISPRWIGKEVQKALSAEATRVEPERPAEKIAEEISPEPQPERAVMQEETVPEALPLGVPPALGKARIKELLALEKPPEKEPLALKAKPKRPEPPALPGKVLNVPLKTNAEYLNTLKKLFPEIPPLEVKVSEKEIRVRFPDGTEQIFDPVKFHKALEQEHIQFKDEEFSFLDPTKPPYVPPEETKYIKDGIADPIDRGNIAVRKGIEDFVDIDPAKNKLTDIILERSPHIAEDFFKPFLAIKTGIKTAFSSLKKFYYDHLISPALKMGLAQQILVEAWRASPEIRAHEIAKLYAKAAVGLSPEDRAIVTLMFADRNFAKELWNHPDEAIRTYARSLWDPDTGEGKAKALITLMENTGRLGLKALREAGYQVAEWPESALNTYEMMLASVREALATAPSNPELLFREKFLSSAIDMMRNKRWIPRSYIASQAAHAFVVNNALDDAISFLKKKGVPVNELVKILKRSTDVIDQRQVLRKLEIPEVELPVQNRILLSTLVGMDDIPLPPVDVTPILKKYGLDKNLIPKGYAAAVEEGPIKSMQLSKLIPQYRRIFQDEGEAILWALNNGMGYILDPVYNYANYLNYIEGKLATHYTLENMKKLSIEELRSLEEYYRDVKTKTPSLLLSPNVMILPLSEAIRLKAQYGIDLTELGWKEWSGTPALPNLRGYLLHPVMEAWLRDEAFIPVWNRWENANKWWSGAIRSWDKFARVSKMLHFYIPMIMVMNDLAQMWMLGAAGPSAIAKSAIDLPLLAYRAAKKAVLGKGSVVSGQKYYGLIGYLAQGLYDVVAESNLYRAAKKAGLMVSPNKFREDVGRLAVETLERLSTDNLGKRALIAIKHSIQRSSPVFGIPVAGHALNIIYRDVLQWLTWKADEILRMGALRWYLDTKARDVEGKLFVENPVEFKAAVDMVRKFMVNYRGIPHQTRRYLNLVVLTPTYRIEVAKLYGSILKGLREDPATWWGPVARIFTAQAGAFTVRWWARLTFLKLLSTIVGAAFGGLHEDDLEEVKEKYKAWRRDIREAPGWTLFEWYHIVSKELPGGMAYYIALGTPLFELNKYIARDPRYTMKMYGSVPVHMIMSIFQNQDWKGDPIVKPFSGPIESAISVFSYLLRNSITPYYDNLVISKRDNWRWWNLMLAMCGITLYRARHPVYRLIAANYVAERKLQQLYRLSQTDPRYREQFEHTLKRIQALRERTHDAIRRYHDPSVVARLMDAYVRFLGVSERAITAGLINDVKTYFPDLFKVDEE